MRKTKSQKARELLAEGMTPCEVAKRVGGSRQLVSLAATRGSKRGRPRKHYTAEEVAEACARLVDEMLGVQNTGLAQDLRRGEWRTYLSNH